MVVANPGAATLDGRSALGQIYRRRGGGFKGKMKAGVRGQGPGVRENRTALQAYQEGTEMVPRRAKCARFCAEMGAFWGILRAFSGRLEKASGDSGLSGEFPVEWGGTGIV